MASLTSFSFHFSFPFYFHFFTLSASNALHIITFYSHFSLFHFTFHFPFTLNFLCVGIKCPAHLHFLLSLFTFTFHFNFNFSLCQYQVPCTLSLYFGGNIKSCFLEKFPKHQMPCMSSLFCWIFLKCLFVWRSSYESESWASFLPEDCMDVLVQEVVIFFPSVKVLVETFELLKIICQGFGRGIWTPDNTFILQAKH